MTIAAPECSPALFVPGVERGIRCVFACDRVRPAPGFAIRPPRFCLNLNGAFSFGPSTNFILARDSDVCSEGCDSGNAPAMPSGCSR